MKNMARKFLKRMLQHDGFIADGLYEEMPRFWPSNNKHSSSMMDINLYYYLIHERYIAKDRQGKYLITKKGIDLATPWYKKIF